MNKFIGKVVIVTGASSGIGKATSLAFAKENAKLCLVDISGDQLKETKSLCEKEGTNEVLTIQVDLTKHDQLSTVVDKTVEKFGRLDVLANIAGIAIFQPNHEVTQSNFQAMMNVNVCAPFFLSQQALPHLEKTKGVIINMSSCASKFVVENTLIYSMTKAAIDCLTKGFSASCSPKGVRVSAINPGIVYTPIWNKAGFGESEIEKAGGKQPFGMINPEDVAKSVIFLASDDAKFITGVTLPVDGGIINTMISLL